MLVFYYIFLAAKNVEEKSEVNTVAVDDGVTLSGSGHVMLENCLLVRYW